MQTVDEVVSTGFEAEVSALKKRNRWLGWLAGILAVAVVALGAWLIFGTDDGEQSLTAEQEQMLQTLDEAYVAWNAGDGEALAALFAGPGSYHDNGDSRYYVRDGELATFVQALPGLGFSVEKGETFVIDRYVISGDFIPADSDNLRLSVHRMSSDGTKIVWHHAMPNF